MEQLLIINLKKKGHSRLLSNLCCAFRVLNRKLLSQNNVKYDKPLCSISLVGAWEGVGDASETLIYSISRLLFFCLGFRHVQNYPKLTDSYIFVIILGNSEKVIFTGTLN